MRCHPATNLAPVCLLCCCRDPWVGPPSGTAASAPTECLTLPQHQAHSTAVERPTRLKRDGRSREWLPQMCAYVHVLIAHRARALRPHKEMEACVGLAPRTEWSLCCVNLRFYLLGSFTALWVGGCGWGCVGFPGVWVGCVGVGGHPGHGVAPLVSHVEPRKAVIGVLQSLFRRTGPWMTVVRLDFGIRLDSASATRPYEIHCTLCRVGEAKTIRGRTTEPSPRDGE